MNQTVGSKPFISSKSLLFLKICFYCNIAVAFLSFLHPVTFMLFSKYFPNLDYFDYMKVIQLLSWPSIFLWGYCIYFYYKFDRYSSAGIKLFFLSFIYAPIYFYKVIWKRKRELINEIKHEPVLNNKIFLENIEVDEHQDNSFWDANFYKNPSLQDEMITVVEQTLDIKLPQAYIDLLRIQNGGYTKGFVFPMQTKTSWADDHVPLHELYGIVTDVSINSGHNILDSDYLINEWQLPNKQVIIAGEGHWWITLDYRNGIAPTVRWIDIDCKEDIHMASSFAELIKGLIPEEHLQA